MSIEETMKNLTQEKISQLLSARLEIRKIVDSFPEKDRCAMIAATYSEYAAETGETRARANALMAATIAASPRKFKGDEE